MSSKWLVIGVKIQTRVQTRTRNSWTRKDSDSSLKKNWVFGRSTWGDLLSIISFWYDFGVKFCLGKIAPSFFHLPIEWSAAEAPLPWRWEGTPPMDPLPLLIRPWADSNCCSNSRTFFESHPTLMSLWHFLWTSNLHCVHLNPWRPSPQIRSWQYAQKALWNEKEENESITQRKKILVCGLYIISSLTIKSSSPVLFQICQNSDCRNNLGKC